MQCCLCNSEFQPEPGAFTAIACPLCREDLQPPTSPSQAVITAWNSVIAVAEEHPQEFYSLTAENSQMILQLIGAPLGIRGKH